MTAVVVAHDGAGWLSHGIDAVLEQTRPPQRVVAVDTGSRDRSGTVLTSKLGQGAVFGMDRSTGYATAVHRALQHKAATAPVPASQARGRSEQMEWIWLLHDDCEPAPDALEQLLRGAAETPTAAVLGPKLRDWTDRDVILEAGISLDTVGRRVTGIEPHEIDQGQHDGDRDVLAVSSAGMLVRRDVWEQMAGFDPSMTLFGEDIDLCWRVHGAGLRVRVITDAVVYHALAATRGRRPISVGRRTRMLERRNALQTLLGNLPTGPMLVSLLSNLTISLVRTLFYIVAKRGTAALDEAAALIAVVGHPLRLAQARGRRARGRRAAYSRVRADLPAGHSIRKMAEFVAFLGSRSGRPDAAAGHSAIDDPTEDDSLLIDSGFLQRFLTRPGVLLTFGLIIIAIAAEHSLIGGGPLGGGAMLPAFEGSSQLWAEVLQAFHPVGIGSASAAPPYAGFIALLATILVGKVWLAVDLLLLGCVPLAGVTALLALRRVTSSASVRVWAAASYALLPVAFGAIAAGRLGSAVAFVLIPVIGLLAGRMFSETPRLARRAAWAAGLVLTVATSFVPLLWPMAVVAAVVAVGIFRRLERALLVNLAIVILAPPVLLVPWMLQLAGHPSALLLEAGIQQPGLATPGLPARSLLLLSPGGPGLPPYWASAAVVLAGLLALIATKRRVLIVSGWSMALLGFGTAAAISRLTVTPTGGQPMTPWPGPALAVAAAGLLLAAATAADGLARVQPSRGRKGARRQAGRSGGVLALLGLVAVSAPLLGAAYWVMNGVSGPVTQTSSEVIPALVPLSGGAGRQVRTLVLSSNGGHLSYVLLRTDSPLITDSGLVPVASAQTALNQAVAALVAPSGGQAVNQSALLAKFDIGFVLLRAPVNRQLASQLDGVAGLTGVSVTSAFDLWRLTALPSRVSVVEPNGVVVPIDSGPVSVSGAAAPTAGGTLELAEPAGGWTASLNGHPLQPIPSPAGSWAQAFRLPPGGGTLSIGRASLTHDVIAALELLAFVVVAVLALPGVRTAAELEAAAAESALQASEDDEEGAAAGEDAATPPSSPRRGRGAPVKRRGGRRGVPQPVSGGEAATEAQPGRRAAAAQSARDAVGRAAAGLPGARRVGAAAGLAGARAAAGGTAAAGRTGAAGGTDAAAGAAADLPPLAAWPAGQPASRFIGGPPDPGSYRDDPAEPVRQRQERPGHRRDDTAEPDRQRRERPAAAAADEFGGRRSPATPARSPSGSRFDDGPGWQEPVSPGPQPGGERRSRSLSPSGARFDDQSDRRDRSDRRDQPDRQDRSQPRARTVDDAGRERGRSGPAASPEQPERRRGLLGSMRRSDNKPGHRGQPASHSKREASRAAAAERKDQDRASSNSAASTADSGGRGYSDGPGSRDSGRRDQPGYRDSGWRDALDRQVAPGDDRGRSPGRGQGSREQSSWSDRDQQSWRTNDGSAGWPDRRQQQGWQEDYQSAPQTRRDSAGPQGWSEHGDSLEALPPVDEVHHDGASRRERSRRGWIAPSDEADGDDW